MFKKILIANRGEIALRIIRACKELNIETVAVYSEADAESLAVRFADEAVCIGPPPSSESYLSIPRIISAAEVTNADAIHPGYGFLAENAHFAEVAQSCDIQFIGPTPELIEKMGNKSLAKETMKKAGLPVIPGSEGILKNADKAKELADSVGYPIILKASAGGGGKGMRIVREPSEMANAFQMAQNEAGAAFGDDAIYMEKFFEHPRHIEVQILGDNHGNIVALGERECSVQRKHQKLLEESPSAVVTQAMRKELNKLAMKGAKYCGYSSAGTMEFLLDTDGKFYFMEMNTRIQVEHPVTEMVMDVDLVKDQIRVAAGEKIRMKKLFKMRGHAIECRINAEDPDKDFRPSPGKIIDFHAPGGPGIRIDTHVFAQYVIPPYYDSLIVKVIAHGNTREDALMRMKRALEEFVIEGIHTTIPFHQKVLANEAFWHGKYDIRFIEILQAEEEFKKGH
ncbi:biotin carboxylase [bacterium BMS3Bbin03]|nr:biotin carboxylase [bacterium BMS3Bbin03]